MSEAEVLTGRLRCRGCRGWVSIPDLRADDRERIADLFVADRRMAVIHEIRRLTAWDLRESKRVMLHLTRTRGRCHFEPCASELTLPVEVCPVCRRVNLDWLAER